MKQTWFFRMLVSYMPIFFLVTSFLFLLFFQSLIQLSKSEANSANKFLTTQILNSVDNQLKAIDNLMVRETLSNQGMADFFETGTKYNVFSNYLMVRRMNELINAYPLIETIYLINFENEMVISNHFTTSEDSYLDGQFIAKVKANPQMYHWKRVRLFHNYFSEKQRQVVSYVQEAPYKKGFIVVNVSVDKIRAMVNEQYDSDMIFVHMKDSDGSTITSNHQTQGNTIDQSINVLTKLTSPYTGWVIESGYILGNRVRLVSTLTNLWVILGLFSVLSGIVWMIYITRRNYRPIKQIMNRVHTFQDKNYSHLIRRPHRDEFKFIESALNEMIEQSNHSEQQREEDAEFKKRYLFSEILEGLREVSVDQWKSTMGLFKNIPEPSNRQIVLVIEIDNYPDFTEEFNMRDQSLLKFALIRVVQEIAQKQGITLWPEWISPQQQGVIIFIYEPLQDYQKMGDKLAAALISWVEVHLKFTVSVGIGGLSEDLSSISESYREAMEALQYKAILGSNRVIHYDQSISQINNKYYAHFERIHSIIKSYRLHQEQWRSGLNELFISMKRDMLARDGTLHLLNYFLYYLNREVMEMVPEYHEWWQNKTEPELSRLLHDFETLDSIREPFHVALEDLQSEMKLICDSGKHHQLLKEVREYIENSYTNPNLSLEYLSDKYDITVKYLSKLFKEEFGEKFVDFIIRLRINHAKQKLCDSDESLQKIARDVGYSGAISLNRVFNRVVGISPGQYRRQQQKK